MGDRSHDDILAQMSADLDQMFQKMGSVQRKQELNRHSAMAQFGSEMATLQAGLVEAQNARKPTAPPTVERGWTPPQSVKQANQQFQRFTKFAQERDEDVDASAQELLDVNNKMIAGLDQIFAVPP
jgi:hypothetical protein